MSKIKNWTLFWDMNSGGGLKEPPYDKIYIEAEQGQAESVFYSRFGHNPHDVACSCCGNNYSVEDYESLEQASAYHRNCAYDKSGYIEKQDPKKTYSKYIPLDEYVNAENVLIIREKDILPNELNASLPEAYYPDEDFD